MFRLEHGEADRSTLKKALPTLSHIQEAQSAWKDDFALNSMLRKRFRVSRAWGECQDLEEGVTDKVGSMQGQPSLHHVLSAGGSSGPLSLSLTTSLPQE